MIAGDAGVSCPVAAAMIRVFIEHGDRTDRKKARLKHLLEKMSLEEYLALVEKYKQPVINALGALALYLVAFVVATSYFRVEIGRRRWKLLHYTTYAAAASAVEQRGCHAVEVAERFVPPPLLVTVDGRKRRPSQRARLRALTVGRDYGAIEKSWVGNIVIEENEANRRVPFIFFALAVLAAVLAMRTKEIAATLPLPEMLDEFTFTGGVARNPERERCSLHSIADHALPHTQVLLHREHPRRGAVHERAQEREGDAGLLPALESARLLFCRGSGDGHEHAAGRTPPEHPAPRVHRSLPCTGFQSTPGSNRITRVAAGGSSTPRWC